MEVNITKWCYNELSLDGILQQGKDKLFCWPLCPMHRKKLLHPATFSSPLWPYSHHFLHNDTLGEWAQKKPLLYYIVLLSIPSLFSASTLNIFSINLLPIPWINTSVSQNVVRRHPCISIITYNVDSWAHLISSQSESPAVWFRDTVFSKLS